MKAQALKSPGKGLEEIELDLPRLEPGELLLKVLACGVCRTDIHIVDGELKPAFLPIIPGHEVVGKVVETRAGGSTPTVGELVGVTWLAGTCGTCRYCLAGRENLCDRIACTGLHRHGGFSEFMIADARFCYRLPATLAPAEMAPLLCAGLIGFRSLRFAEDAASLGLYGFGAAAHITAQVAAQQGRSVYAFTRPNDHRRQAFALKLGCTWAGGSDEDPPLALDAAIIFAPDGRLVPKALRHLRKGGKVICGGIHMSDIPGFAYRDLWNERQILSVANVTREDAQLFFDELGRLKVQPSITTFPLSAANAALTAVRNGDLEGAAVLLP